MYVCMYVYMYVCMYVCMSVRVICRTYVCTSVCGVLSMCVYERLYMYIYSVYVRVFEHAIAHYRMNKLMLAVESIDRFMFIHQVRCNMHASIEINTIHVITDSVKELETLIKRQEVNKINTIHHSRN
jgi:hypothetical protein